MPILNFLCLVCLTLNLRLTRIINESNLSLTLGSIGSKAQLNPLNTLKLETELNGDTTIVVRLSSKKKQLLYDGSGYLQPRPHRQKDGDAGREQKPAGTYLTARLESSP
jgi:hypothetical protein